MKCLLVLCFSICSFSPHAEAESRKDIVVGKQRYAYDRSPFDRN